MSVYQLLLPSGAALLFMPFANVVSIFSTECGHALCVGSASIDAFARDPVAFCRTWAKANCCLPDTAEPLAVVPLNLQLGG